MHLGRSEGAQDRGVRGISSSFGIEFLPKSAKIFRLVVPNREHPVEYEFAEGMEELSNAAFGLVGELG
jgi:hypothetical protein